MKRNVLLLQNEHGKRLLNLLQWHLANRLTVNPKHQQPLQQYLHIYPKRPQFFQKHPQVHQRGRAIERISACSSTGTLGALRAVHFS